MTHAELLAEVKRRIGVTGSYQDDAISGHIQDVKDFMLDAGVSNKLMGSDRIIGAVTRGVSDLWNYGSGNGEFSPYFFQRVTQLVYRGDNTDGPVEPERITHLCPINLDVTPTEEGKSEIILVNRVLYGIEIDLSFTINEDWHKDEYYFIGKIANDSYWPVSNRILMGSLSSNEIEAAKQNFFKLTTEGEIYVYSDLNCKSGSVVKCILSDTYM